MSTTEPEICDNGVKPLLVAQHNYLARAYLHFSDMEAKIFTQMLRQVMGDTETKKFKIKLTEVIPDTDSGGWREQVDKACMNLYRMDINVKKLEAPYASTRKKDWHWVRIVQEMGMDYGTGYIKGMLTDTVKGYLLGLNEFYTVAELEKLLTLPSGYAHRLFWILQSYETIEGSRKTFEVDDIKKMLCGVPNPENTECTKVYPAYAEYKDFNRCVLKPALKEVSKLLNYTVKSNKQGNKVVSLTFIFPDGEAKRKEMLEKRKKKREAKNNSGTKKGAGLSARVTGGAVYTAPLSIKEEKYKYRSIPQLLECYPDQQKFEQTLDKMMADGWEVDPDNRQQLRIEMEKFLKINSKK
ncbi:RepB [Flammeovirgaceae bacterium 311]|nr:RepB [Flammeovirgaceae bacterium 311]